MNATFFRVFRRQPTSVVAMAVVLGLVVLSIIAPSIWGDEGARLNPGSASLGMSWAHPFGTDSLGRDVLARTLTATRLSLALAILAVTVAAGLGICAGLLIASVRRASVRSALARLVDAMLAFPGIIVALFFAAIFDLGGVGAAVAVGLAGCPSFARFAYTLSLSVRSQDFVAAAQILGLPRWRVTFRHVLPNMAEPLVTSLSLAIGSAIVTVSALSFLGLGVQPLKYDWGSLLTIGLQDLYENPAAALGPGLAIILAGTAFGALGDGIASAIDPRNWTHSMTKATNRLSEAAKDVHEAVPAAPSASLPHDPDYVLRVENLRVSMPSELGDLHPVDGVSFGVRRGEVLGIVGESGSGKSLTVQAIAGVCPYPGRVSASAIEVCGKSVLEDSGDAASGTDLAVVFQDPMSALNPALRIQTQMTEALRFHRGLTRSEANAAATDALKKVGISAPELRMKQYPHELSGGMRQRVAIASGLAMEPPLLLADEPTTALDVTLQAQIIRLLEGLTDSGMGVVLVSHDISVISEICDRVVVMYAGRVVEEGPVQTVLKSPVHPYTQGLVNAVPELDGLVDRLEAIPGSPYRLGDDVTGCAFATRCALATDRCAEERPVLVPHDSQRQVACWHVPADLSIAKAGPA